MSCQAGERKTAEKVLHKVGVREGDDREGETECSVCIALLLIQSVTNKSFTMLSQF